MRQKLSSVAGNRWDFLQGFAWNHAAKITEYVLLYIFSVVVARSLGPFANGLYATLVSISQLLLTFSSVAFDLALNRFVPQFVESEAKVAYLFRQLLTVKIILLVVLCVVLFFSWNFVGAWFSLTSPAGFYLTFVIALGCLRAISSSFAALWISQLQPKMMFVVNSSSVLLQILAVQLTMTNHSDVRIVFLIVLLGSLFTTAAYIVGGRKYFRITPERIPLHRVRSFIGWLWANALVAYVYGKQGDIMLLSYFAIAKTSIGFYDVASSLSMLPGFIVAAGLSGISVSMFSRLTASQPTKVPVFWAKLSSFLTRLTIPVYCFMLVYSSNVIAFLYSGVYSAAAQLLQMFLVARIAARLFGGGENLDVLLNLNAERPAVILGIGCGAMNLALNLVLIPHLGVTGAVLGTGITTVFMDASTWFLLRRRARVPLLFKNWIQSLAVGVIPVAVVKLLVPNPTVFQLALCGLFCIFVWSWSMILRNEPYKWIVNRRQV